jgi:hypothetical protein
VKRTTVILTAAIALVFLVSWILKAGQMSGAQDHNILRGFLVTCSAFLTLAIMSFLYQDNPFYKFAEHFYVGMSAAYWMSMGFWSTIVGNLIPRLSRDLSDYFRVPYNDSGHNFMYWLPVIFGLLLLMRLSHKIGWISRWSLAFIVGTTAGFNLVRYLRSDFIEQISSTFIPMLVDWQGFGNFFANLSLSASGQFMEMVGNWVVFFGVVSGLIYFFFSREHTGWFGKASRFGVWILMLTFGAAFGYTVMGRISLLVGRITFLFRDWLSLIQ